MIDLTTKFQVGKSTWSWQSAFVRAVSNERPSTRDSKSATKSICVAPVVHMKSVRTPHQNAVCILNIFRRGEKEKKKKGTIFMIEFTKPLGLTRWAWKEAPSEMTNGKIAALISGNRLARFLSVWSRFEWRQNSSCFFSPPHLNTGMENVWTCMSSRSPPPPGDVQGGGRWRADQNLWRSTDQRSLDAANTREDILYNALFTWPHAWI